MNQIEKKEDDDVFGKVYLDFYRKTGPEYYFFEREDGLLSYRLSETYFQKIDQWNKQEQFLIQTIFDNNFTSVLDIGSGAGRVSLYLQEKGLDVVALDISPGAIDVCRSRGIKKYFLGSIFDYQKNAEIFDCVLLLGNNLAIGQDYDGTRNLLTRCNELISSDGQILLHSLAPIPTNDPDHLKYHEINNSRGKRIGEIIARIRYRTLISGWFQLFFPTETEFNELIKETGLQIVNKWASSKNSFYIQLKKIG